MMNSKTDNFDTCLDDIESFMKKESRNRQKLIDEVTNGLDIQTQKMVEYNQKLKNYQIVCDEYKKLHKKYKNLEKATKKYIESKENIEEEVTKLKMLLVNSKKENTTLRSILQLLVDQAGFDLISGVTKIPVNKLKEYLEN